MAKKVNSEHSTLRMALEAAIKTAPATGWVQVQTEDISEVIPDLETVENDPFSKWAADEKGDHVGLKAMPKFLAPWSLDLMRLIASSMFRSNPVQPGGTNQTLYRPTAVVDGGVGADSFSVPLNGALTAGRIVRTRGFGIAQNNSVFVVDAGSDADSINVPTGSLVAEAAPPANATLDVIGVQGAASDIQLNASGNLTSATLNFTTLGLVRGMRIIIGDVAVGTRFNTLHASKPQYAFIAATPTANEIQLTRRNFAIAADTGVGKTIRIFWGNHYQNRAGDDATFYVEPTLHGEVEDLKAATNNTASIFTYLQGLALGSIELTAPLKQRIMAKLNFVALDIPDPVLTANRVAGPASAIDPLASAFFDTAIDLEDVKVTDSNGDLIAEVNSWSLTVNHEVEARNIQGEFAGVDHTYGKIRPRAKIQAYFTDWDQIKAARANRDLTWSAMVGNHQGGFSLDMPYTALREPKKGYVRQKPIMLDVDVPGFKDPTTNVVLGMTVFAYVPNGGANA